MKKQCWCVPNVYILIYIFIYCLMPLFRLGQTQAFMVRGLVFLFLKRGTSKTWKIIEALRYLVLLINSRLNDWTEHYTSYIEAQTVFLKRYGHDR